MKLAHILSRVYTNDEEYEHVRQPLPWIAGPLDRGHGEEHGHAAHTDHQAPSKKKVPHFKHHHEASTIELFYDLFFVANLATFTANHEIVNGSTFKSYLGFFSLIWITWLHVSLFDVRFAAESVTNRIYKAIHFGVFAGFAVCGTLYDPEDVEANLRGFKALAIILMVARLTLVIQYSVVLWYVRSYESTFAPLITSIAMFFSSAIVFLGCFFSFEHGNEKTYYAFYIVSAIEVFVTISASCVWRVLSFKQTNLVERIGLLTLIIMGEGIIGISKSIGYIFKSSKNITSSDIGLIVASVLLIYCIWILYFDQIQHDHFGTIRQQIWALLHYPLHIAILFTVEGSTNLVSWNIVGRDVNYWYNHFPSPTGDVDNYMYDPPQNTTQLWGTEEYYWEYFNESIDNLTSKFASDDTLLKYYNYTTNIAQLQSINATWGTQEWTDQAVVISNNLLDGVSQAIFQVFGFNPDEKAAKSKNPTDAYNSLANVIGTVVTYFYAAAGALLITYAVVYYFGKKRIAAAEWGTIAVRIIAGIGLIMTVVAIYVDYYTDTTSYFFYSSWHIPMVMLVFLLVIFVDSGLIYLGWKRRAHHQARKNSSLSPARTESSNNNENIKISHKYDPANSEDTSFSNTIPHSHVA